jgi:ABC-2 type transport system ATP-binding protein
MYEESIVESCMYAVETVDLTRTYVRYNYKGTRISMDADDNPGGLFLSLYNRYFNRNVVKEEVVAVDHVNIKIPRSELVCLLGPNGSGKTTLLRVLATLLKPTSGTAYIMGHDIVKEEEESWRHVTYIAGLLTGGAWMDARLTPRQILLIQSKLYGFPRERINDALKLAGLEDVADARVATFSTGMLARLSVAIGLLRESPVYLLDEPMSGISRDIAMEIYTYMKENIVRKANATIIYATHNLVEAEMYADRVILMHRGKVIAQGKPEELITETFKEQSIDFETSNCTRDVLKLVEGISGISSLVELEKTEEDTCRFVIYTENPRGVLPKVITTIVESGGEVKYVKVNKPTLEDIFIKLVRERLGDRS